MQADISRGQLVRAAIMILISGVGIGFLPNLTKLALLDGGAAPSVLLARTAFALAALGAYIKITGGALALPRQAIRVGLLAGIALAIQNYTAIYAIKYIDISLFMLILFIHPFFVAIYYHFTGSTPLTPARLLWSALAFVGVAIAISVDFTTLSAAGLLLSLGSALSCAVLIVAMVRLGAHAGMLTATFQLTIYPLVLAVISVGVAGRIELPASAIGWIGITGAGLAFVVSFVAFLDAARIIGGSRASVMSFIEPIFAIVIAAMMFGESLTSLQWAGTLLVALSLFMLEAPAAFAAKAKTQAA